MEKRLLILLVNLIALVTLTNAQIDIDSLKLKFARFKKYQISKNLIGDKWINAEIGFNDQCDTIFFQGIHYDLPGFNSVFDEFMAHKSLQDTILMRLDFGDHIFLDKVYCSYDILANQIEKFSDKGIYYFITPLTPPAQEEKISIKTDTINLHLNQNIEYNGEPLKFSDLSNHLKMNKPELVILRIDSGVPYQIVTDIFGITKKLMIETVIGNK